MEECHGPSNPLIYAAFAIICPYKWCLPTLQSNMTASLLSSRYLFQGLIILSSAGILVGIILVQSYIMKPDVIQSSNGSVNVTAVFPYAEAILHLTRWKNNGIKRAAEGHYGQNVTPSIQDLILRDFRKSDQLTLDPNEPITRIKSDVNAAVIKLLMQETGHQKDNIALPHRLHWEKRIRHHTSKWCVLFISVDWFCYTIRTQVRSTFLFCQSCFPSSSVYCH